MESRFQKVVKNAVFATINQIVSLLLNVVNRTIFIWILGVEYLGINGLFADVLIMLSLADLGLGTAMVYSYYKPLNDNDTEKLAQLTQFYKKIYALIACGVAGLGMVLLPFLKYLVNLDNNIDNLYLYYLLMVANTVASYLFIYKSSILNADQKNFIVSKYLTLTNCMRMLSQIVILIFTRNYALYLLVQVVTTIVNNLMVSRKADKLYPYINNKVGKLDAQSRKDIFTNIKSMALYKISLVVFGGTDNTLISVLVGTIWTGYYSNYNMIITTINTFINILYNSATASIGNVIVSEHENRRYEVFKLTQLFSLLITTITTVCLWILTADFIKLWLGADFVLDNTIFITILLNFYFNGLVHPIWSFREACGLYRRTKYIMMIAAIVNLVLSVILGRYWGIAGILMASLIARIVTYFWFEPRILFKEYFLKNESEYYLPLVKNVFFTGIVCWVAKIAFSNILVGSWIVWILKAIIVFVVISGGTVLFYWKEKELRQMILTYLFRKK